MATDDDIDAPCRAATARGVRVFATRTPPPAAGDDYGNIAEEEAIEPAIQALAARRTRLA